MLLAKNRVGFKVLAVVVALALVMPMVMMPAGAASAGESNDKSNTITLLVEPSKEMIEVINSKGAEIEIIEEENMPVIVVPYCCSIGEEIYLPFKLPATMEVLYGLYGDKVVTVEVEGNYLLIPIEGEIERVCISDFDVREIRDGQVILEGEVNPWKIIVGVIYFVGSVIAIGTWVHDLATSNDQDRVDVRRWLTNRSPVYAGGIDVFTPAKGITGASVSVEVRDLDHGERVIVYLIGARTGEALKLRGELPTTGDNVKGEPKLRIERRHVDEVCELLRKNNGRIIIKLEKVSSSGSIWIQGVEFGVDW